MIGLTSNDSLAFKLNTHEKLFGLQFKTKIITNKLYILSILYLYKMSILMREQKHIFF